MIHNKKSGKSCRWGLKTGITILYTYRCSQAARFDASIQKSQEGPASAFFSYWSLVTCHWSFAKRGGSIVHHSNAHAADGLLVSWAPCLSVLATAPACGSRAKHFCNAPLAADGQLTSRALDASATSQSSCGETSRRKFCNGSAGRCKIPSSKRSRSLATRSLSPRPEDSPQRARRELIDRGRLFGDGLPIRPTEL
jgi:hypothetical protein